MGTGKTAVGRIVARIMGREFYDMDFLITLRSGLSINEIFESMGELHFRKLEHDVLLELNKVNEIVIATGGGTFVNSKNSEMAHQCGTVFCLRAAPEVTLKRIANNAERPLLNKPTLSQIEALLDQRKVVYDAFEYQIETSFRSIDEVAQEIVSIYRKEISNCTRNDHES